MSSLPVSVRSLSFSALRAGSLFALRVRPSMHSFSGFVLVAAFRRQAAAAAWARRWAARLGLSVAVRLVQGGWAVSVPVSGPVVCRAAFVAGPRSVSAFAALPA